MDDPLGVALCLDCGFTLCVFWSEGERVDLTLDDWAWREPAQATLTLRRALEERALEARDEIEGWG
jgi:hypothetical protein